ncbi:MAG TPA: phosphotransferase [Thermomicrobiales bacterium]|nr:phosphotransferase [Thermomicrobiales bacterium]
MTDLPGLVLDALVRSHVIAGPDGWRVAALSGGTTSRTFSVLDPDGRPVYIARLARPGCGDWLRQEEAVLRELGDDPAGCAPAGVARIDDPALPEGQLLVHQHVAGAAASLVSLGSATLEALAACLAWVHGHARDGYMLWPSLAVQRGARADCYRARIATLRQHSAASALQPEVDDLLARVTALDLPASAGWDETSFALIHGDLSNGNILLRNDGSVTLIDWEYARDGDPAEELAYLIAEHDLAPDIVADLADAYASAGGDPWTLARMPVWLPYVALDSALWWAGYLRRHGLSLDDARVHDRLEQARRYLGG